MRVGSRCLGWAVYRWPEEEVAHDGFTGYILVSAPDPFYTLPMRMRKERGGAGKKGSGDTA